VEEVAAGAACSVDCSYSLAKQLIAKLREVGQTEAASLATAQKRIYSLAVRRGNKIRSMRVTRDKSLCQPGHDDSANSLRLSSGNCHYCVTL